LLWYRFRFLLCLLFLCHDLNPSPCRGEPGAASGKRKTDLLRSVSLLAPHHPSDHVQVAVQRLSESPVSTLSVWLRPLCSISRRGPSESPASFSGRVGWWRCLAACRHGRRMWRGSLVRRWCSGAGGGVGCRARIRTWAKGSKFPCAATTPLGSAHDWLLLGL
jgi:hypothetical protein